MKPEYAIKLYEVAVKAYAQGMHSAFVLALLVACQHALAGRNGW
jgi:hypothetical protein